MAFELIVSESANVAHSNTDSFMHHLLQDLCFYFRTTCIINQFSACCISHVLFQLMEITASGQNSCNAV